MGRNGVLSVGWSCTPSPQVGWSCTPSPTRETTPTTHQPLLILSSAGAGHQASFSRRAGQIAVILGWIAPKVYRFFTQSHEDQLTKPGAGPRWLCLTSRAAAIASQQALEKGKGRTEQRSDDDPAPDSARGFGKAGAALRLIRPTQTVCPVLQRAATVPPGQPPSTGRQAVRPSAPSQGYPARRPSSRHMVPKGEGRFHRIHTCIEPFSGLVRPCCQTRVSSFLCALQGAKANETSASYAVLIDK